MLSCCGPVVRGISEGLDECVVVPGTLLLPPGAHSAAGSCCYGAEETQCRAGPGRRMTNSGPHACLVVGAVPKKRRRSTRKADSPGASERPLLEIPKELCEDLSALGKQGLSKRSGVRDSRTARGGNLRAGKERNVRLLRARVGAYPQVATGRRVGRAN